MTKTITDTKIIDSLDLTPMPLNEIIEADPEIVREQPLENDDDFELAKKNLRHIILLGTRSMKNLLATADSSQDTEFYASAADYMNTLINASKELVATNIKEKTKTGPNSVTNHNTLQITSADLQKMLEASKKNS